MKKILSIFLVLAMMFSFAACKKEETTAAQTAAQPTEQAAEQPVEQPTEPAAEPVAVTQYPLTITDQIGRTVTIEQQAERIVSGYYISSSTLIALGLTDKMVGVEEKIEKRPIYKLAAPQLIDTTANVGSAKQFNLEACIAANPDVVFLPKKAKDNAASLEEVGIKVIVVNPESHEKLVEMINIIAQICGAEERASQLVAKYDEVLAKLDSLSSSVAEEAKPTIYMCGTSSYLTTAPKDMYQASVIRSAGGKNAGDEFEGDSWVDISYEQLIALDPDIILIPTNNMANGQPDFSASDIIADPQFKDLKAVQNNAVYNMPVGYEAWDSPVPSGILGMLWLSAKLYPDQYSMDEFASDASDFYSTFYGFTFDASAVQ